MAGVLKLPVTPFVMGVLNVIPDPTTAGGQFPDVDQLVAAGESMLMDGAACIDVVGLSNLVDVKISIQEEIDRVIPVIELLSKRVAIPVSINTSNPEVMEAAVNAGASIVNDIRALTKPGAISTVAKLGVYVCLMHMYNDPTTMHLTPGQKDLVVEVYQYFEQRIAACEAGGIDRKKIIVDPGFGYGKNLPQNLNLLRSLPIFKKLNCPLLIGMANKSMIGQILDVPPEQRIFGSIAAVVIAISHGADIIRTHDVKAMVDAIKVLKAIIAN